MLLFVVTIITVENDGLNLLGQIGGTAPPVGGYCGNGQVDLGEECDKGEPINEMADGCFGCMKYCSVCEPMAHACLDHFSEYDCDNLDPSLAKQTFLFSAFSNQNYHCSIRSVIWTSIDS